MYKRKYFALFVLLAAILLVLAACTTTENPSAEPTEAVVEESEPTDETEVEPTEAEAAEPTDEPAVEPTKEPAAEPSEAPVAEESAPVAMVMARTASCYLSPGASADELGTVLEDTNVNVLGRGVGAGWLAIEYPNDTTRVCWIQEADVEYDGEFSELPIYGRTAGGTEDEDEPIVLPEGEEYPVLNDVLCLRGPGGGYSTVRALLEGEVVIVHGRGVGLGWYVVALPESGENCWLPDTAIDFTGVYEDLTIFATPPKS
jgi:hypothetical protein